MGALRGLLLSIDDGLGGTAGEWFLCIYADTFFVVVWPRSQFDRSIGLVLRCLQKLIVNQS